MPTHISIKVDFSGTTAQCLIAPVAAHDRNDSFAGMSFDSPEALIAAIAEKINRHWGGSREAERSISRKSTPGSCFERSKRLKTLVVSSSSAQAGRGRPKVSEKKAKEGFVHCDPLLLAPPAVQMFIELISPTPETESAPNDDHNGNWRVEAVCEFVEGNLSEKLTTTAAALHAGCSVKHFCRIFERERSTSFTVYVARVRVAEARRLLMESSQSIKEIAYLTGFGSIAQFNRTFKRVIGMTPTECRRIGRSRSHHSPIQHPSMRNDAQ